MGRDLVLGTTLRVLVVEDSVNDAALTLRELERGGYDVYHERVETLEKSVVSSVESLVELNRRMSRGRYEVHLSIDSFSEKLSTDTGRGLVRIVQEALNNARRHSGARNVWVTLKMERGDVCAEVVDNGQGFDAGSTRGGIGTSTMRQRALDLGGKLEIESEPSAGTVVRFRGPADHLLEDRPERVTK